MCHEETGRGAVPALAFVALVAAADITGNWEVEATFDDSSVAGGGFDCVYKQQGEQLTGNCSGGTASVTGGKGTERQLAPSEGSQLRRSHIHGYRG